MEDDDLDLLASVPVADAKIAGGLIVRAPGTLDEHIKKDCWLEVPVIVYPKAPYRSSKSYKMEATVPVLRNFHAETVEEAVVQSGIACSKFILLEKEEDIDEDLICREVVENDAIIVFSGKWQAHGGISPRRRNELLKRAEYWVVEGRKPEEEGGQLCGYQFCDRFIRWVRRVKEENREENNRQIVKRMHETTRSKGRASRRTYFIDNLVNRFAERVGMSRQRVMAKLLDDGMMDVMLRSVDQVKPILFRDTPTLLRGRVSEAVDTLEFYYRAQSQMSIAEGDVTV